MYNVLFCVMLVCVYLSLFVCIYIFLYTILVYYICVFTYTYLYFICYHICVYNRLSQRIDNYIEDLTQALLLFTSIVAQVHKNSIIIHNIISHISSTQLLTESDFHTISGSGQPFSGSGQALSIEINEWFDILETNRQMRLDVLVEEYKTIGDTYLLKIEEIVAHTNTGMYII